MVKTIILEFSFFGSKASTLSIWSLNEITNRYTENKGMRFALSYLLFLVFVFGKNGYSQKYNFQNFTTNQGLASNQSYYSLQGEDGYVYVSTDRGLQRFDGKTFSQVPFEDFSLNGSTVFKIIKDHRGTLWVSTYKKGLFYLESDTLRPYKYNSELLKILKFSFVEQFFFDAEGNLYFSTMQGVQQVYIVRPDFQLDSVGYEPFAKEFLLGLKRIFIKRDQAISKIQFQNPNKPPLNDKMKSFTVSPKQKLKHKDAYPRGGPSIIKGDSALVAVSHILAIYSIKGEYITEFDLHSQIMWIMVDSNEDILAATMNGFYRISKNGSVEHCLSGYPINCITQDDEKGYWINTTTNGLFYLPSFQVKMLYHGHRIAGMNSFGKELVISHHNHFLSRYKLVDNTPIKDTVLDILKWSKGIYLDAHTIGVTGEYFKLKSGEIQSRISGFQEGKDYLKLNDSIILAAKIDGVKRIRLDNPLFRKSLIDSAYFSLSLLDHKEHIYIGANNGLIKYNKASGKHKLLLKNAKTQIITDVEALNDSTIICSSKTNGIFLLTPKKTVQISTRNTAILSNGCSSLAVQNDSVFWVGTDLGIAQIVKHKNGYRCYNLGKDDGLLSQKVNDLVLIDSTLFVGTDMGCCYFNIHHLSFTSSPIRLIAEVPHAQYTQFANDTIWLKKGVRNLVLNFSAISFKHTQHLTYSYTVKGQQTVKSPSNIFYINRLEAGTNKISVDVANSNGFWNSKPLNLVIISPPYFYEKTGFIVFASFLLAFILIGLIYGYLTYHYRKKLRKWKMSTLQLRELNLQLNPHFIFNAINNLYNLALHGEKSEIKDFISRFSGLTRKVLENSRFKVISMEEEMENVKTYVELEKLRFKEHPFDFILDVEDDLDLKREMVPPMILQPIIENAIWHGLLPKKGKRCLSISLKKLQKGMEVCIQDNGVGLHKSSKRENPIVNKSSIGVSNTQMRLELYEGMELGKAQFELTETTDHEGKASGVRALFRFYPNPKTIRAL